VPRSAFTALDKMRNKLMLNLGAAIGASGAVRALETEEPAAGVAAGSLPREGKQRGRVWGSSRAEATIAPVAYGDQSFAFKSCKSFAGFVGFHRALINRSPLRLGRLGNFPLWSASAWLGGVRRGRLSEPPSSCSGMCRLCRYRRRRECVLWWLRGPSSTCVSTPFLRR
jgi:hypothetical protein